MRSAFEWNGLEVAYRRAGDGPPLVFLHGAASDGRLWQPQLEGLADEFTVVAWDEPGAGESSDIPADFDLAGYADCLAALIEHLELGAAHVAGLSWGGTVALELYRRRPDLVASLVMIDSYAGWKGSLPEEEVRARVEGTRQMLAAPAIRPHAPGPVRRRPAGGVRAAAGEGGRRRPPAQPQGAAVTHGRGGPERRPPHHHRPDPARLGRARRALAARRRASVPAGDPGRRVSS